MSQKQARIYLKLDAKIKQLEHRTGYYFYNNFSISLKGISLTKKNI